jgi:hypothetical protein
LKEIKISKKSTTDPESGYMMREGKPEGFFYLDHRTVDSLNNIITDVYVTPGNINDVDPYLERLDRQIERFKFETRYVGLDAGYFTNPILKGINDRKINSVVAYRRGPHEKGKFTKNRFQYIEEWDAYACPGKSFLRYKTTNRQGYGEYVSNKVECKDCNLSHTCLTGKNEIRTIRRHVWEKFKEKDMAFLRTEKGKRLYKRRKETIERSFADSKELHGLRYCRFRGLEKTSEQCLLTAACMNMKKIARMLA